MRAAVIAPRANLRRGGGDLAAGRSRSRRLAALRLFVVPRAALLALAGCGGSSMVADGPPGGSGAVAASPAGPVEAVEAFLAAAGHRDHAAMARHFGTAAGPIGDRGAGLGCALSRVGSWIGVGGRCPTEREVELRMDLMAAILAHESYRAGAPERVAGRGRPAARVEVEVNAAGGRSAIVPFVVIEADDGRWLVAEVGLGGMMER